MSKATEFRSFIRGFEEGANREVNACLYAAHWANGKRGPNANREGTPGHWWKFNDESQVWISDNGYRVGATHETPPVRPGLEW